MKTMALRKIVVAAALVATSAAAGCGDDDAVGGSGGSGAMDAGGSGGSGGSGGTGGDETDGGAGTGGTGGSGGSGGGGPCDPSMNQVTVDANITADTRWTCGTYLLQQIIYVTGNHTLTIDPGVRVLGDITQTGISALIITRGSKLDAQGTAAEPIVFSSSADAGDRLPGDWGGVVLLGQATINTGNCVGGTGSACSGGYFENVIEGLDPTLDTSKYGGTDDAHDCGTLKYARIEYAGFELAPMKELNGLTVGGCGTGTELSYIQVNRGSDDGIEMFGGTAGLDHIVISGPSDDGLDWDLGWRGKVQFLVVHQTQTGNDGDKGFEADNLGEDEDALPRSKPTLFNVTLIGNPAKTGMVLREGTQGTLRNFLVTGFATAVDLAAAQVDLTAEWPGNLSIENSCFFGNTLVGDADSTDDDMGFIEADAVQASARNNVFNIDPMLGSVDNVAPNYIPASTMLGGKATPPSGFDVTATYCGAFAQGGTDWTANWTSFLQD